MTEGWGVAAIMTKNGKTIDKLHFHLGKMEEHTAFEAELVGMILGLQLIKNRLAKNVAYAIGVDNQAAIRSLASKLDKSGHYLAAEVLDAATQLKKTMEQEVLTVDQMDCCAHRDSR